MRQPLPRATPCLSRNNPPMESRRAQPKRAAQDAYAQSRAVSQEPLMLEPGARAISKKHRPADMLAPPGSQALSPSDNGRALGREPQREPPTERGEEAKASSPPAATQQPPQIQQTPTQPVAPPEASAMSPQAEQRMVTQILMAYGLSGEIGPHIPDLGALMQIEITHSEYIDQELSMHVAAAAAEATTARRICARNEAGACLAMARAATSGLPGPPLAVQATATKEVAPRATALPAAACKALTQASTGRTQPPRHSPGRQTASQPMTQVEIEDADRKALVSVLMTEMPATWRQSLMLHVDGKTVTAVMDEERRASTARAILLTKGASVIKRMIAAQRYHKRWAEANGMEVYPVPTDVACAALQDRMDSAVADAAERKRKREAKGKPPASHSRGGVTAAKAVRLGYRAFGEYLGLDIDGASPMVQAVTAAGPGEPSVGQMIPIDIFLEYQHLTNHPNRFVAARAGAAYLQCASSLRVIDQMRTPDLHFESVTICDSEYTVVTGTTAKSKAVTALQMRPLPWRVPLISVAPGPEVNLGPLLEAMGACPCMWPGMDAAATDATRYTQANQLAMPRRCGTCATSSNSSRACEATPEWTPSAATTGAMSYRNARAS